MERIPEGPLVNCRQAIALSAVVLAGGLAVGASTATGDGLPPGYAYEAVSPVLTQGQRVGMTGVSPDASRVMIKSVGGFAGTENLPDIGVEYEAIRTDSGWVVKAIAPPASQFPFIGTYAAVDFSEDLTRSLWYVNKSADAGTHNFTPLLRDESGSFSDVAPTQIGDTEGLPTGSSSDLRTVVLASIHRPSLTDGTVDTRAASRRSMVLSVRQPDGSVELKQVAYRLGDTMLRNCEPRLGGSPSARGSVSADGGTVFFSFPSGLSSCVSAANQRVWAKVGDADPFDLAASQCTVDCGSAAVALFQGASRDGRRVYFTTDQKLLDADVDTTDRRDLYEYDFDATGSRLRVVTGGGGAAGAGVVNVVRVSESGTHVYFVATGRALAGANARGVAPQPSNHNLYVYRRSAGGASGSIEFVAQLDPGDSDLWLGDVRRRAQLTPDGRFMIFASKGDLTDDRLPGDTFEDIFRYDALTGDLRRIWVTDPERNGAARTGPAVLKAQTGASEGGGRQKNWKTQLQITDDGSMVGFDTVEPLSADDTNDQVDAYLWRAETNAITMLTSGDSRVPAQFGAVSPTGDTIFVSSSEPLVGTHVGGSAALFAIRKGGGFPEPPADPDPCRGDLCQGEIIGLPPLVGPPAFFGPGNVVPSESRPAPRLKVGQPTRTQRLSAARTGRLMVPVTVGDRGRLTVRARARVRTGRSSSVRQVARVSVTPSKVGKTNVRLRLSAVARRTLRVTGRLTVTVTVRSASVRGTKMIKVALRNATTRSNA